ncbi:flavin reductase family protein [Nonomuraea candida]|uniref:flavin reductase family protein n=1 Tax=Nonomuraea candida TaxID=359159 RepID=UPI000693EB9D|nr:flavin reductase family protein [Nonomuraea candida]
MQRHPSTTPPEPSEQIKALRRAFGTFATGVTVVTTGGDVPHAMTANSFTSVSLDPPLLLVCIDKRAVMHQCLTMTRSFGVSVLASHQEGAARHFSNRYRALGAAQFEDVGVMPGMVTGVPLIKGSIANFECEVWRCYDGGDHSIFIGKVVSLCLDPDAEGLLVYKGKFREIAADLREVLA